MKFLVFLGLCYGVYFGYKKHQAPKPGQAEFEKFYALHEKVGVASQLLPHVTGVMLEEVEEKVEENKRDVANHKKMGIMMKAFSKKSMKHHSNEIKASMIGQFDKATFSYTERGPAVFSGTATVHYFGGAKPRSSFKYSFTAKVIKEGGAYKVSEFETTRL